MVTSDYPSTVRVPNIDLADTIAFGLTARQLAYATITLAAAWVTWTLLSPLTPIGAAVVCGVLGLCGVVLVFVRRDGASIDRLLLAAASMPRRPLIPAPAGITAAPGWMNAVHDRDDPVTRVGILKSPARGVTADGHIDLGPAGLVAVLAVDGLVNFTLRSADEQGVLVAGFASALHAISGPIQIVTTQLPMDLSVHAGILDGTARALSGRLGEAAAGHAAYLRDLGSDEHALLQRHVLVAVAAKNRPALTRRIEETATALSTCGLETRRLSHLDVIDLLTILSDPYQYPPEGSS